MIDAEPGLRCCQAVYQVRSDQADAVVDVFVDAFRAYPIHRFVLATESPEAHEGMRSLAGFFVLGRVLRHEPVFGIDYDGRLAGVALVADPAVPPGLEDLFALRRTWARLGLEARRRYEAYNAIAHRFVIQEPHLYLTILAVRNGLQGRGLGRSLLDVVHAVSESSHTFHGVSLNTETTANVAFYRHFGYEVIRHDQVGEGLETWTMYRPNH